MDSKKNKWVLAQHLTFDKAYVALYLHSTIKAQLEIVTKRKRLRPVGKGEVYLYLEGYGEEFRSEKELMDFYNNLDDLTKRKLKRRLTL